MTNNQLILIAAIAVTAIFSFLVGFLIAHKRRSKRYAQCRELAEQALKLEQQIKKLQQQLWEEHKRLESEKQDAELMIHKYRSNKGKAEAALEKYRQAIAAKREALQQLDEQTQHLQKMQQKSEQINAEYNSLAEKTAELETLQNQHAELLNEISLYTDIDQYIDQGLYPLPSYGEITSGAHAEALKANRDEQKAMLREGTAYSFPQDIEITGNERYDQKLAKNQGQLLIRAFNSECDYLISKVSSKNFEASMTRIEKLAEQLEKRLINLEIGLNIDYVNLKMAECTIYYQYICQKAAEAEEQRELRAQMREEAAAQREIEKALRDAEREEQILEEAMARIRTEMLAATEEQRLQYEAQLSALALKLEEAEAKGQRALSMAQQTKRGHVYIISNIGSFGEDVFKIGLTRRLEPMDRINELGDASVPFPFDVHALIYSDDAPALERELHTQFAAYTVNKINPRKEFFEVPLEAIRAYTEEQGIETHWTLTAEATQYRQSIQAYGNDQPK